MTHRLLVNPGTPQSWEIQLKTGTNRIGRREDNDHQINHLSVSSEHCEITVTGEGVRLKDLGSTNGTFINRAPVQETLLQSGQHVQLGNVDMIFESVGSANAVSAGPLRVSSAPVRLSISRPQPAAVAAAPPPPVQEEEPSTEPPVAPPIVAPMSVPGAVCKSHPKTPARFHCQKCRQYFCDLCIMTRATAGSAGKFCRACGSPVVPLQVQSTRVLEKGFFARLPGAVVYPFRGFGVPILLIAGAGFGGIEYLVNMGMFSGPFGWAIRIGAYGFLFLFMQNIIYSTTSDESEPLSLPDASELFGAAFQLGATIGISFGLTIGLLIARFFDVDVPIAAIVASVIFGCLYFPMAFLAVAMKDSVLAANPLVVIPAILKMPLEYLVASILLMSVFGLRELGSMMSGAAGEQSLSTRDMSVLLMALAMQAFWAFANIYLLTVNIRILGLLYVSKKQKFGWFRH